MKLNKAIGMTIALWFSAFSAVNCALALQADYKIESENKSGDWHILSIRLAGPLNKDSLVAISERIKLLRRQLPQRPESSICFQACRKMEVLGPLLSLTPCFR